jgi:hypothetical protein
MHSIGHALVLASLGGLVLVFMTGRWTGRTGAVLVFLTGTAGWMMQQEWLISSFGVIVSVIIVMSGVAERRRRAR